MSQISPIERATLKKFISKNVAVAPLDLEEGIGTVYERLMIDEYLFRIQQQYGLKSILESPADGVTGVPGINSLEFARHGASVTLANPVQAMLDKAAEVWRRRSLIDHATFRNAECDALPFADNQFDLAWNYCMFERFDPPDTVLAEMARVSRYVMIMNQNYRNWGTPVHKLYHKLADLDWDHGYLPLMSTEAIEASMKRVGLEVIHSGCIDIPPWMDTWDMPLRGALKVWLGKVGMRWEWHIQDENQPKEKETPKPGNSNSLTFFKWVELNLPAWFQRSQTHHYYVLGRKIAE
jgi:SAM-dependent methyltransferase